MPWNECTVVSQRQEFLAIARQGGWSVSDLARRFGISRKTAYKWLARGAAVDLRDRSRRPRHSPAQTPAALEQQVLELRQRHPTWGGRKLRARLLHLGAPQVPAASTITAILHRHGLIDPAQSAQHRPWQRFEHPQPNDLWQMDFKGHFALTGGGRCHPLTVLDDHSRYALTLWACGNEQADTVQEQLTQAFRTYGLPWRMLMDNGPPWGNPPGSRWTALTVWLLRLGVRATHGRPFHPQTQGKDERFHRTLVQEVLQRERFADLAACQRRLSAWRVVYNQERPHQALGDAVPASRYRLSARQFPERVPEPEPVPGDLVRTVDVSGRLHLHQRRWWISKAFRGLRVGLRPTLEDGVWAVWYAGVCLGYLDEVDPQATGLRLPEREGPADGPQPEEGEHAAARVGPAAPVAGAPCAAGPTRHLDIS